MALNYKLYRSKEELYTFIGCIMQTKLKKNHELILSGAQYILFAIWYFIYAINTYEFCLKYLMAVSFIFYFLNPVL